MPNPVKEGRRNGMAAYIISGSIIGLLLAATAGAWSVSNNLAALTSQVNAMDRRLARMDTRIERIEDRLHRIEGGR